MFARIRSLARRAAAASEYATRFASTSKSAANGSAAPPKKPAAAPTSAAAAAATDSKAATTSAAAAAAPAKPQVQAQAQAQQVKQPAAAAEKAATAQQPAGAEKAVADKPASASAKTATAAEPAAAPQAKAAAVEQPATAAAAAAAPAAASKPAAAAAAAAAAAPAAETVAKPAVASMAASAAAAASAAISKASTAAASRLNASELKLDVKLLRDRVRAFSAAGAGGAGGAGGSGAGLRGLAALLDDPRNRRIAVFTAGGLFLFWMWRRSRKSKARKAAEQKAAAEAVTAATAAEAKKQADAQSRALAGLGSDKYDIVVDSEDIRRLASGDGWDVEVSPSALERAGVVVGVLGVYNRGKTFVLNKISNSSLPANQRVRTRGVSIKLPRNNAAQGLVLLDTAGLEAPVQISDMSAMEARGRTDLLNTEMAYRMSDVVVVVVSDVTLQDQAFLKAVYEQLKSDHKRFGDVIVVHNFKDVEDVETLEALWKAQVEQAYPGVVVREPLTFVPGTDGAEADAVRWWRHASSDEDSICMRHVVLGREGTAAGAKYNANTFKLLHKWVSSVNPGSNVNVLQKVVDTANDALAADGVQVRLDDVNKTDYVVSKRLVAARTEPKAPTSVRLRDRLEAQRRQLSAAYGFASTGNGSAAAVAPLQ